MIIKFFLILFQVLVINFWYVLFFFHIDGSERWRVCDVLLFSLKLGLYDISINFYFIQSWSSFSKAAWSQYAVLGEGRAKAIHFFLFFLGPGRFLLFNPIYSFTIFELIHRIWSSFYFQSNFNLLIQPIFQNFKPIPANFSSP